MKILLCGDSFTAHPMKTRQFSWVNQLDEINDLTNLSQPGCSEYKIWLQLKNSSPKDFDLVMVSHTSPNRLYTKEHPKYHKNHYHKNADFIYTDIEKSTNPTLNAANLYFEYLFDEEYALEMHQLLCEKIETYLQETTVLHLSGFDYTNIYHFEPFISLYDIFVDNRGEITHLTENGNFIAYERITNFITSISGGDSK